MFSIIYVFPLVSITELLLLWKALAKQIGVRINCCLKEIFIEKFEILNELRVERLLLQRIYTFNCIGYFVKILIFLLRSQQNIDSNDYLSSGNCYEKKSLFQNITIVRTFIFNDVWNLFLILKYVDIEATNVRCFRS